MEEIKISLAAARVNAKLTQANVANIMKLNKQTIVNWENGKIVPKVAQLEMLSRLYNIPIDNISLPIKST